MANLKLTNDTALSVQGLYKNFKLPHERKNSLKERLLHFNRKASYDTFHALRDINFEVKKGEFFGIVGRNGSGKSTLLKIIGGIYQPTKGSVTVNGTLTPFIELGIGFNPELTGRENVFLNGAILGLTRKEIVQKYKEIVDFAELEKFMDQKLKNYSSGMQVRLAFSIAIQAHNDILLIDEVLAVGDSNFQRKCFQVFREIKNSGKTVIFVTHAMSMVQEFCDRAMMIQDSRLIAIGEPRDIAMRYDLANAAGGGEASGDKLERPSKTPVKILDFKVTSHGKKSELFSLADDITGEVTIDVKQDLTDPIQLNMFFIASNGEQIANINTYNTFKAFVPKKGTHKLKCRIDAGQLVKDQYRVGVGVATLEDMPQLYDIVDPSYEGTVPTIMVTDASNYQSGRFYIKGYWSNV
jgi:ABC-2 type transport system ATP-binding protein